MSPQYRVWVLRKNVGHYSLYLPTSLKASESPHRGAETTIPWISIFFAPLCQDFDTCRDPQVCED